LFATDKGGKKRKKEKGGATEEKEGSGMLRLYVLPSMTRRLAGWPGAGCMIRGRGRKRKRKGGGKCLWGRKKGKRKEARYVCP